MYREPSQTGWSKSQGASGTRFNAATTLVASNNTISNEFLKLRSNKGGTCFGDSGSPNLQ